ncbi:hypothetical protein I4U23_005641 [Adineta vaga]|nr:hypothetical protein I4U23_005641 [Adineta vaga]
MATTSSSISKRSKAIKPERFCLVSFQSEGTHGIWPENLIRTQGRYGFEAKFGKQWFACRIEKEGSKDECEKAQDLLEKSSSSDKKQWSSAETELSANDDSSISSSSDDEHQTNNQENLNKKISKKNKIKTKTSTTAFDSTDGESEILKDISSSINKKRAEHFHNDSKSKKSKPDDTIAIDESPLSSSTHVTASPDSVKQLLDTIVKEVTEMKKITKKVYQMQKRLTDGYKTTRAPPAVQSEEMIENNVNLMTLPATTPSRYLLSIARIVLTDGQFNNGYLPDFRGDRTGRVPIPEEAVEKLKKAVRQRFSFKEADMGNIWQSSRTSLVQKVSDVRKSNRLSGKSKAQQDLQTQQQELQTEQIQPQQQLESQQSPEEKSASYFS